MTALAIACIPLALAVGLLFGYERGFRDGLSHVVMFKGLASDVMDNEAIAAANAVWRRETFGASPSEEMNVKSDQR